MYLLVDNSSDYVKKVDFKELKELLIESIVEESQQYIEDQELQKSNFDLLKKVTFAHENDIKFIKEQLNSFNWDFIKLEDLKQYLRYIKTLYNKYYDIQSREITETKFSDIFKVLEEEK